MLTGRSPDRQDSHTGGQRFRVACRRRGTAGQAPFLVSTVRLPLESSIPLTPGPACSGGDSFLAGGGFDLLLLPGFVAEEEGEPDGGRKADPGEDVPE